MVNVKEDLFIIMVMSIKENWLNDKIEGYVFIIIHMVHSIREMIYEYGRRIETWGDGAIYNGEYEDGKKCEVRYFRWADDFEYKGEFYMKDIHSKGIYTWADGRKCVGAYVENCKSGYGEMYWSDGRQYRYKCNNTTIGANKII